MLDHNDSPSSTTISSDISPLIKVHIPLWEIEKITTFVHRYRHSISPAESILLDRLLTRYEQTGTFEARKDLKTFLIYLRRSVNPTPTPRKQQFQSQIIDLDTPDLPASPYSKSVTADETPRRPPPFRCPRNNLPAYGRKTCSCKQCLHARNVRRSRSAYHLPPSGTVTKQLQRSHCSASTKSSFIQTLKAFKKALIRQRTTKKFYYN